MFEEKYNKRIIPPYVNTPIGRNVRPWFNKKNLKKMFKITTSKAEQVFLI